MTRIRCRTQSQRMSTMVPRMVVEWNTLPKRRYRPSRSKCWLTPLTLLLLSNLLTIMTLCSMLIPRWIRPT